MGVTTTTSINEPAPIRCGRCGGPARGGVVVLDANNKNVGVCCAKGLDLVLLEGLTADAEDEPEPEPIFIAHDPFDHKYGVHPAAVKALLARMSLTKTVRSPVEEKTEILRGGGAPEFDTQYRETEFGRPEVVDEIAARKAHEAQERLRPWTESEQKFYRLEAPVTPDGLVVTSDGATRGAADLAKEKAHFEREERFEQERRARREAGTGSAGAPDPARR